MLGKAKISRPEETEMPASQNKRSLLLKRSAWAVDDERWHGQFEGKELGTNITVLFYTNDKPGTGPRWHIHPYDEVFVVRSGRALFTIGEEKIEAETGEILLGPANLPHKFVNLGAGRLETTDIHLSSTLIQTDLDDPDL